MARSRASDPDQAPRAEGGLPGVDAKGEQLDEGPFVGVRGAAPGFVGADAGALDQGADGKVGIEPPQRGLLDVVQYRSAPGQPRPAVHRVDPEAGRIGAFILAFARDEIHLDGLARRHAVGERPLETPIRKPAELAPHAEQGGHPCQPLPEALAAGDRIRDRGERLTRLFDDGDESGPGQRRGERGRRFHAGRKGERGARHLSNRASCERAPDRAREEVADRVLEAHLALRTARVRGGRLGVDPGDHARPGSDDRPLILLWSLLVGERETHDDAGPGDDPSREDRGEDLPDPERGVRLEGEHGPPLPSRTVLLSQLEARDGNRIASGLAADLEGRPVAGGHAGPPAAYRTRCVAVDQPPSTAPESTPST